MTAMKLLNLCFLLLAAVAIVAAMDLKDYEEDTDMQSQVISPGYHDATSLRGVSRILGRQNLLANMTCNLFPQVCRLKNSPGRHCCGKKCVNMKTDRLNCGMCERKCKYSYICCKGKCVNPFYDRKHCGGCETKCKKGDYCIHGICGYA